MAAFVVLTTQETAISATNTGCVLIKGCGFFLKQCVFKVETVLHRPSSLRTWQRKTAIMSIK